MERRRNDVIQRLVDHQLRAVDATALARRRHELAGQYSGVVDAINAQQVHLRVRVRRGFVVRAVVVDSVQEESNSSICACWLDGLGGCCWWCDVGQRLYKTASMLSHHTGVLDVTALAAKMVEHDSVIKQIKAIASDTSSEATTLQVGRVVNLCWTAVWLILAFSSLNSVGV